MIGFEQYAKVKNKYCICYFGHNDEYLTQLDYAKSIIEKALPGIEIHIGCKDDKTHLVKSCVPMKLSEIKIRRKDFAYVREMKYDGVNNPVVALVKECGVNLYIPVFLQDAIHSIAPS